MCGIAGFLADSGGVAPGRLARMLAALRHRGPDGEGTRLFSRRGETALVDGASERDPAAGLAHARLAVLDLSADGAEPMSNEDGSWWLTFNGEIYNHLALRNELTAAGHTFRSRCDAEVILHGLEAWGVGLPARLRGMYAWAALHLPSSSLWLARDPWGIKPVYLALTGSVTAFASELTALEAGGFTGGLSRQALEAYVGLGFVPSPLCLLEGVRKLRPGELVRVQGGRAETLGMVAPPMPPQHRTHQGALNAVESEVQEVLKDS
ncbi:MAG: asparagine synthetase B, partial [Deltaproteobacteria bacterium]|nr:asparagine synthetase B [Deltaproteobacteria bacterium]